MLEKINLGKFLGAIPVSHVLATIVLFIAAFIIKSILKRVIKKAFTKTSGDKSSFWSEFWVDEQKFISRSISWIIWISFIGVSLYIWSDYIGRFVTHLEHIYAPAIRSVIIIIAALLALKTIKHLIHFIVEQFTPLAEQKQKRGKQRVETLSHTFHYGSTILVLIITVFMLLNTFGIDLKALLATVGVASLAIGFGAQSLVKDVVNGVFILIEDQYGVGDVITINGEGGLVERMTLRITQLRNTHGMLITIQNGSINTVKNLTSEWSRVDYKIGVAYDTNLDFALDALMDEATKLKADMPNEIIDNPERIGVDEFGDSAITIRIWIKTEPLKQWAVQRELNRRVHLRFEKDGIEIPFPQQTLWIREPREELLAKLVESQGS
jgi:moderate conductance mechanosensitive channel